MMLRQAFRSILLSVLTVCFFAVVLFPRDAIRARGKPSNAPDIAPIADTTPAPELPDSAPAPKPPVSVPAPKLPDSVPTPKPLDTASTPKPPDIAPSPKLPSSAPAPKLPDAAPAPEATTNEPDALGPNASREAPDPPRLPEVPAMALAAMRAPPRGQSSYRRPAVSAPEAVERPVRPVARALRSRPTTASPHESAPEARERPARRPVGAVTVSGPNETIRDVALRVYGSAAPIDQLWRANRDVLPERDTPLRPGTLLRTPAPKAGD